MKILINYVSPEPEFVHSRRMNTATGYAMGGFEKVIEYSLGDIDANFRRKNEHILKHKRGAGYWLWKPYIVRKTLEGMGERDFLFYCDACSLFVGPIDPFIELMRKKGQDVLPFTGGKHVAAQYTKRDAFILMDCDAARYADSYQLMGGFHLWRKTAFSMKFVNSWLSYAQDERIITDRPNQCGKENYPGFIENRHDQSILSLLCKKNQLEEYDNTASVIFHQHAYKKGYTHFRQTEPSFIFHFRIAFRTCYYFCLRYPMKLRLNFLILREICLLRVKTFKVNSNVLKQLVARHLSPMAKHRIKQLRRYLGLFL